MGLSDKALLVYLSISAWAGRKQDKRATATVASAHLTKSGAGNYSKKLLPNSKELEKITSLAGSLRKYFYDQSLPWLADGARIISSKNYLEFTNEFRKRKGELDNAVTEFLAVYPTLKANAQNSLGSLYNPNDYPDVNKLKKSFDCELAFMPLPEVTDFRTEVTDYEKQKFIEKMKSVELGAVQDCWSRLHEVVSKAAQRLAAPDAVFRDSLLANITDICALLPKLNITNDPELEKAGQNIAATIKVMKPDLLRDNANDRSDAAKKLADITNAMGAFMGGAK